jgi:putative DNA primase/helicase
MMDARSIARALSGVVVGRDTVSAPGPGHSPEDRSLSIKVDANASDGFVVYSHAGDDWKACRDYVRSQLGLPGWQPGDKQNRRIPPSQTEKRDFAMIEAEAAWPRDWTKDQQSRIDRARRIWDEADDPRGTLAETYLQQHRQLELPNELAGSVLRFHSACPWRDENTGRTITVPALIAAFRQIDGDIITGIHRIRLNADGSKYDRRMLGIVRGAAVKLSPVGKTLAIGEGVETCMAAQQLDITPAWALGSVGAISFFPIINGVEHILLLSEAGSASQQSIEICGTRWRHTGRRVQIIRPSVGSDLNDALIHFNSKTNLENAL